MKYVINHTEEFSDPIVAFFVGFFQTTTGILTEFSCICFIGTVNRVIEVVIKYMALSSIARVDDIYAGALTPENRIKSECKPLQIKNFRRNLDERIEKHGYGFTFTLGRWIYKFMRMLYSSYIFYFFPYTTLMVTYIANWWR